MKKWEDSRTWTRELKVANFIYYTFGWWLLLLYTIFFVASTSLAKCYSGRWLWSWLFSEETLWVAWVKPFLEVLDNNSNNNNDNNNDKKNNNNNIIIMIKIIIIIILITIVIVIIKIYLPHPFLQCLFVP